MPAAGTVGDAKTGDPKSANPGPAGLQAPATVAPRADGGGDPPLVIHVIRGKADPNTLNGVNRIVNGLATAQVRRGKPVEVWGISARPREIRHEHDYPLRMFSTFGFRLRAPREIREAIGRLSPESTVVHFHSVLTREFYAIAVELERRGIEWVHSPHGGYSVGSLRRHRLLKRIYFALFEHRLLRGAAAVLATGQSEVDDIVRLAPRARVVLIRNGQEAQTRIESPPAADIARPLFGFCGRFAMRHKGLDLLVDGFARYARGGGRGTLWLIGDGDDAALLRQRVGSLGLSDRVIFKGPQFGDAKTRLLCQLDYFVHTSRWEGLPMALLDASALGIPMLVSKQTNFGEFVEADGTGIILERNEPDAIAAALLSLEQASATDRQAELRENAARAAMSRPDWNAISAQIERELYGFSSTVPYAVSAPAATTRLEIVSALVQFLGARGIQTRLLADPALLAGPAETELDLLIGAPGIETAVGLVRQFCNDTRLRLIASHEHGSHGVTFYISHPQARSGERIAAINICSDVYLGHALVMRSEEALARPERQMVHDVTFDMPPPEVALTRCLAKTLGRPETSLAQFAYLRRLYQQSTTFPAALSRWLEPSDIDSIRHALEADDIAEFSRSAARVLSRLRIGKLSLRDWPRLLRRTLRPTGLLVVVAGPDGAGKSTLLEALASRRYGGAFQSETRMHLRPNVIAPSRGRGKPVTDPHGKPPYGPFMSLAKLVLLLGDYTIGYLATTFEPLRRSGLVLYDHYYHDLYVDPRRIRYGGPGWAARLVGKLIPRPDIMFVLDAPAEQIYKRKQEVTFEECVRQTREYRSLAQSERFGRLLDATKPAAAVSADAETLILAFLAKRERTRLARR